MLHAAGANVAAHLRVEPTSPGFKTMAKGKVPTPHGDVEGSWNWADDKISLDAIIPDGTEAEVILSSKTKHIRAGHHHFESACKRAL